VALDYKTLQAMTASQRRHADDYCPECGRLWRALAPSPRGVGFRAGGTTQTAPARPRRRDRAASGDDRPVIAPRSRAAVARQG
jgi:hypothetical protein